ncbi:MAG: hypothetical protein MR489_00935 [Prevotella sp.]|nr:hypothetical protein [Prevotella sp.]
MRALPFIIRAKRAGVWAHTKDHSRGEIGVDGLEILDILGDNEEEHGGRGRGKRVKEKRMRKEDREENNKEREERKENGELRKENGELRKRRMERGEWRKEKGEKRKRKRKRKKKEK